MEIVPHIGETPVNASTVTITVNPDDRRRSQELVLRTLDILSVTDQDSFLAAKRAAGQLKAMVEEIEESRKAANRPFRAVETAVNDLAKEVAGPVLSEQKRVLGLLNGWVQKLEAQAREEQRKKDEALKIQIEAEQAKVRAAQEAQYKAEEAARKAVDETERVKAQAEAERRQMAAELAQLSAEMAGEIARIGEQPKPTLVPGGRVTHDWNFKLVNPVFTVKEGYHRLLRIELDKLACKDACKNQIEINPDVVPTLPGIEVTPITSVSVRASAAIELK